MEIGSETYSLNKQQRHECIRALAKWGASGVSELFEAEFARDYSDADELAKVKL